MRPGRTVDSLQRFRRPALRALRTAIRANHSSGPVRPGSVRVRRFKTGGFTQHALDLACRDRHPPTGEATRPPRWAQQRRTGFERASTSGVERRGPCAAEPLQPLFLLLSPGQRAVKLPGYDPVGPARASDLPARCSVSIRWRRGEMAMGLLRDHLVLLVADLVQVRRHCEMVSPVRWTTCAFVSRQGSGKAIFGVMGNVVGKQR